MNQILQNPSHLSEFGNPIQRVENAIEQLKNGGGILLVDDENRENEGDLIFSAELINTQQMAMLIRECSGIVCLCLDEPTIQKLSLPAMVESNNSRYGTAFTVSIEAKRGVTTGVSAADRVATIKTAITDNAKPSDLARPGHVFPLKAETGGVLKRRGHTEGTVDLMKLAKLKPAGVLCELTNHDGTMARLPQIIQFAKANAMPVLSIEDIVQYRQTLTEQCNV